jgi:VanZ family protein
MRWEMMLFVATAFAMVAGCLVPNRWLPRLPNDKLMHFAAYALLSAIALRIARGPGETAAWLLGLLVAGWLVECLQALVPDRNFCWNDILANAAGIAVVAALAVFGGISH